MRFDEVPVYLDAEPGLVIEMHVAFANLRPFLEKAEPDRVALGRALRFHAEAAARKSRNEMSMQV